VPKTLNRASPGIEPCLQTKAPKGHSAENLFFLFIDTELIAALGRRREKGAGIPSGAHISGYDLLVKLPKYHVC
jgi:hypothetical protein